jgi:hypothetical protein
VKEMKFSFLLTLLFISAFFNLIQAVGITTGICYAGCAAVVTACYASAGLVFGTVTAGAGSYTSFLKILNEFLNLILLRCSGCCHSM